MSENNKKFIYLYTNPKNTSMRVQKNSRWIIIFAGIILYLHFIIYFGTYLLLALLPPQVERENALDHLKNCVCGGGILCMCSNNDTTKIKINPPEQDFYDQIAL